MDALGSPDAIAGNWQENFDQTAPYIDRTIAAETYESIREWVTRWFGEHQELLRTRVIEGRIRDGHGDIRAESICVTDGLCIFDCIEFNERSGSATLRVRFVRNGESSSAGSRRS